jgi:thiol-disulfide isomerase/thioredoxin
MKLFTAIALTALTSSAGIIQDVRASTAKGDFTTADRLVRAYRSTNGTTPEMLEALSWIARGELAAKNYDQAEKYATETYQLSTAELKKRPLDREKNLPIALGAAIEVQANVLAARHQRTEAITYLRDQLKLYRATSINARIQKNINLLTMEGKPVPALENVALPKGKAALVFFWAHWCGDCKAEGPILAQLKSEFKDLAIIAPTQTYGYVQGGEEAPPEVELRYIEKIRQERYSEIIHEPAPVSEANFRRFGVSTTPTLVLIDRRGTVRLYHPGRMTYEELRPLVAALFKSSAS